MPLSAEQTRVASIVLAAGKGRLALAGGGALLAHNLLDRITQDIDAFTDTDTEQFRATVTTALTDAGYQVDDVSPHPTIVQLAARRRHRAGGRPTETVQIEVLRDHIRLPPVSSPVGPTLDPRELAANKILAIYDRPRARDFDDLHHLVPPFEFADLLALADDKTVTQLDRKELAQAFRRIDHVPDSSFPHPELVPYLRRAAHLIAGTLDAGRIPETPTRPAPTLPEPRVDDYETAEEDPPFPEAVRVAAHTRRNGTEVPAHWRRPRRSGPSPR